MARRKCTKMGTLAVLLVVLRSICLFEDVQTNLCASLCWQPRLRSAVCDVSMQMDRRAAAGVIIAAPAAAFASSGDSPKQAYFGTAPISAPFGEVYTNQATRLWKELGETEREIYTKIARNTKKELADVSSYTLSAATCLHTLACL